MCNPYGCFSHRTASRQIFPVTAVLQRDPEVGAWRGGEEGGTDGCRSHFLFHSAAGLVSHPPTPSLAEEPESPEEEEGRVTLSGMKMSQCGSITARPTASEEARGQESLNNKTIALSKRAGAASPLSLKNQKLYLFELKGSL